MHAAPTSRRRAPEAPPGRAAGPAGFLAGALLGWMAACAWLVPQADVGAPSARARSAVHSLRRTLQALRPDGAYLAVHVAANRFELRDAQGRTLRSGPCSTGRADTLVGPDGRSWTFATPRGVRRVRAKAENPLWRKPDWAYVEAGLPVPAPGAPERIEAGMLGGFALDLGGGTYVHGTPFTIDIGRSVTHGCVRLLDDDLRATYATLREGDTVILY